jgi:hypothetical protein
MQFDGDGICILESITDPAECDAYIEFLRYDEKPRHQAERMIAEVRITGAMQHCLNSPCGQPAEFWRALARFRDSAATRHQHDLEGIDRLIPKIQAYKAKLEAECK